MKKILGLMCVLVVLLSGCAAMKPYPAVLDSPEMQQAHVEKVKNSDFNTNGQMQVDEPGFRFIIGYVCEGRMVGVHSAGQFSSNEEKVHIVTTQPVNK